MGLILKFWKEGLIILLLGALSLSIGMQRNTKFTLTVTQTQLTESQAKVTDIQSQLDIFKQAVQDQIASQQKAEAERKKIIADFTSQVNRLRKQTPPKECQAAVDWAIDNKSDLSWPK